MPKINLGSANQTTADSSAIPFEEQLKETISELVVLWKPHHREGLTVRLETGRKLNQLIGPPSVRQDYGANALEEVKKQTGVSRSELSRMRKFAEVISELDASGRDHPKCSTWTQVKEYLATVDFKGRRVSKKARRTPLVKGVCRSIKLLTKKFKGVKSNSTPDDRQRVITALEGLAKAVSGAFSITILVKTDEDSVSTMNDSHTGASKAA